MNFFTPHVVAYKFTDNSPPTGEDNKKWYDKIVNTILFPYICKKNQIQIT